MISFFNGYHASLDVVSNTLDMIFGISAAESATPLFMTVVDDSTVFAWSS